MCKKPSPSGLTHLTCKNKNSPEGLITLLDYRDKKVAELIITGKYYFVKKIYSTLGKILAEHLKNNFPFLTKQYTLTPIPLHWMRQNWRGFNQTELLGLEIQKHLPVHYEPTLVRAKFTKTQKDLKKEAREANVQSAFQLADKTQISGQNFILIDDVVTTGSTILEATKILKKNGASEVWCLAVARD
ncbi:MAG: ComF family protein [Candidatus Doudnabacteria bacterium]|nr:ComF family protein [Candidatus Doudnabacteria bacterium]